MKTAALLLILSATLLLPACSTVESRIKEKPDAYASLPEADQQRIRKGELAIGDTMDAVYIALGEPSEKRTVTTETSSREEWIYLNTYSERIGSAYSYRRVLVWDERVKRYLVFHEPIQHDVYQEKEEQRIRVVFVGGKVSTIDQLKR